ncbi:hypothetical protein B9Z65_7072 [Elsinoe australis]|uniref:Uncharacterized protein n=1 Tax=Elsinoe australis TaxID=40998 RepID=A0A2P7Z4G7_9PEZI|nr:hypothetical protein B9Z65_7072 [Elsinoe australis]
MANNPSDPRTNRSSPHMRDFTRTPQTLLDETDTNIRHLSRLIDDVDKSKTTLMRERNDLIAKHRISQNMLKIVEQERDALAFKNEQLAGYVNRVKQGRNEAIQREQEALTQKRDLEEKVNDMGLVVGLLEQEMDRLSMQNLALATALREKEGGSPGKKAGTPKKGKGLGEGEAGGPGSPGGAKIKEGKGAAGAGEMAKAGETGEVGGGADDAGSAEHA